jgi:anti-sigma factor RsiW
VSPPRLIPCSDAVKQLWRYLDETLDPADREDVERHLAFCRRCCGELEFAKELQAFLASTGADEIPPKVKLDLERFVEGLGS